MLDDVVEATKGLAQDSKPLGLHAFSSNHTLGTRSVAAAAAASITKPVADSWETQDEADP